MKQSHLFLLSIPALFALLVVVPLTGGFLQGQEAPASLEGVTQTPEGFPLAGAKIVARSPVTGSERSTVSEADGAFALAKLTPDQYRITATKEGCTDSKVIDVNVSAQQSARTNIELAVLAANEPDADPASQNPNNSVPPAPDTPPQAAPATAPAQSNPAAAGFFRRLSQAYLNDWEEFFDCHDSS